jgi:cytochrome o ubiquinol oxidase subunit 2
MKKLLASSCATLLSGCSMVVLDPAGHVAVQEARLLVISTLLMLLIIVPVIVLTLLFAWRYRAGNDAPYEPDWDHSIQLELVIWSAPLLIIIALGAITWISTHTLNPYRPLDAKAAVATVEPIDVQVVALDWKWLFIYPKLGIATVNELAAPVDVPVRFSITSASVMNSFYIPALAGQIYAMPTMETKLHAVINQPGEYRGISANYSGAGFSDMQFQFHGMSAADFDGWVQKAKASGQALGRDVYMQLARPSAPEPPRMFATVAPGLFDAVVNQCVAPGSQCLHAVMAADELRASAAAGWRPDSQICSAADAATFAALPLPQRK